MNQVIVNKSICQSSVYQPAYQQEVNPSINRT